MKTFYSSSFKFNVAAVLTALLFATPLAQAKPKSYAAHTAEITRLAQANEAGQLQIKKGDALTPIAQRYATANDLPLEVAVKTLVEANPEAFEDAQNNLKVGALLTIPKKSDTETPKVDANMTVSSDTPVEPPLTESVVTPAPIPVAISATEPAPVESAAVSSSMRLQAMLSHFYVPPWAWVLLAVFSLMLLIGLVKRGKRATVNNNPKQLERHTNGAPKVVLLPRPAENVTSSLEEAMPVVELNQAADESEISHDEDISSVSSSTESVAVASNLTSSFDDEDELLYDEEEDLLDDEPLLMHESTTVQDGRFQRAVGGLSAISLDLTADDKPMPPTTVVSNSAPIVRYPIGHKPPVKPTSERKLVAVSASQPNASFFNHHFKTPRHQLAQITNATTRAVTFANVKAEAMAAVKVAPEIVSQNATPELEVDMPNFLREYSHNLPEPTFTSVDYEDLLDRARLQAWLNTHTVDEILLYAQDAHDARYDDVAQLMLNDVLLRGNADQCAAVLNLRYLWSYPQGVY